MLLFKKKFLEAIRRGEKNQTIRLWKVRRMKVGQRSYIPGIGYVQIQAVDPVELDELSDADAWPDGFASAEALRQEIAAIYGPETEEHRAYRVRFAVLPPAEQRRARDAAQLAKQARKGAKR